ncbi:chemotaxis protein CheD [Halocynthiibacter namhaensis]|uniref:chemotaxis protein CheD n=1 Tax=Halocynthiibacter namhaensis TaxID=1290553 RepID=UPI0005792CAD|nr:hypothetical protein [Halocynthiibacter namhaensis]
MSNGPISKDKNRQHITQGQFAVGSGPDAILSTLLGSCVSTCLWDSASQIGGMNHILLPDRRFGDGAMIGEGVNEMELLINGLIKAGARRDNLKAKIFGGARMIAMATDIGETNAAFALQFLSDEGIECVGQSTGGNTARQVKFWPGSGKALVRIADGSTTIAPEKPSAPKPMEAAIELF